MKFNYALNEAGILLETKLSQLKTAWDSMVKLSKSGKTDAALRMFGALQDEQGNNIKPDQIEAALLKVLGPAAKKDMDLFNKVVAAAKGKFTSVGVEATAKAKDTALAAKDQVAARRREVKGLPVSSIR